MFQGTSRVGSAVNLREAVAAAEVILGSSSADRGKLLSPSKIELNLAFSKPPIGHLSPRYKTFPRNALTPDTIQDRVDREGPVGYGRRHWRGNGRLPREFRSWHK